MAVLCVLLAVVCFFDYRYARIPNWIVVSIYLSGLCYRYWDSGAGGVGGFLVSSLAVLLVFYPLFRIGMIGAGDVKLYSAVAGYLSGRTLVCFLVYSLLVAAVISIVFVFKEKSGKDRIAYLCSYLKSVWLLGRWESFASCGPPGRRKGIRLAGPVFLSILLHAGGFY